MNTNWKTTRQNKWKAKQFFILLVALLVIYSQMYPYVIYASEVKGMQEPTVSIDVDGEEGIEVIKGEDYTYNVKVVLPEDISGYETMTVADNLDERLVIQNTDILINEENNDALEAIVEEQNVSLKLTEDQLAELAGKELNLQITTQVRDAVNPGEKIKNMAEVAVNDNPAIETNPVTMILSNSELDTGEDMEEEQQTAEEQEEVNETDEQETAEKPTEINEPADKFVEEENSDSSEKAEDVTVEENLNKEVDMEEASSNHAKSLLNNGTFEINGTDSYGTSSYSTFDTIYQFDGNDPTIVKADIQVTGLPSDTSGLNGLAVSEDGYLYAGVATVNNNNTSKLYRIDSIGQATFVADLHFTFNAAMYGDKYYYIFYDDQNNPNLEYVDVQTKEKGNTPLVNSTDQPLAKLGADMLFDAEGYIWVTQRDTLVQINPNTSEILRVVPVSGLSDVEYGVRGLSFLPDGDILVSTGSSENQPLFYRISSNGNLENLGRMTDVSANAIGDLGSAVSPYFDPFPPVLESEKRVELHEKALGNTDTENPEPGDTLLYTIQTRNTVEEYSLIKELVISDTIPEGLEYVAGTLLVDGEAVTDEADEDKGQVVDKEIVGELGDVLDNDWHTVEFQVTVMSGQAGKTIENVATVDAMNTEPTHPKAAVDVYPRLPVPDACAAPVALINGSFEQGPERGSYHPSGLYFYEQEVPGWLTTDDSQGVKLIEQWNYKLGIPSAVTNFPPPVDGDRWAELNAFDNGLLYQDVETTPGQTISWRLSHMGRQGVDTMQVRIGPATGDPYDTTVQTQMSTGNTAWETYTGSYTVPAGQTITRFGFEAVSTGGGNIGAGNFLDGIFLGTDPCVAAEKTVSPEGEVYAGDELTYEVNVKNKGGDIAADAVFEDAIPEGTEYIPGSIKVNDVSKDDSHYDSDSNKIVIDLGDLPNTTNLPEGINVQFKVRALSSHVNDIVVNQATIQYTNLFTNETVTTPTNEVTTPIVPLDITLTKVVDESLVYVGDVLTYTIEATNESPSGVWNGTIEDELPEGVALVADSTTLNGEVLEDAAVWNEDTLTVSGVEVKAGETTTLMFQVEVLESALNTTVENIATGYDPDNPEEPIETPPTETEIVPNAGELDSDKAVFNEAGEAIDGQEVAVGDELTYTITAENIGGPTTIVNNVQVEDDIPIGLSYVPGTLTVNGEVYDDSYVNGQVVTIDDIGSLVGGESAEVSFSVVVTEDAKGTITNIATVTGEIPPENPEDPDEPGEPNTPEIDVDVPDDPAGQTDKPDDPKQSEKPKTIQKLPQTGEEQTGAMLLGLLMIAFSIFGFYMRKKWSTK
ncbi:MAG: isopeptide-forming domain-containing fimbrial protein [Bacillota bacterium]